MPTEADKRWLYTRENVDMVTGTYFCAFCQYMNDEEEECIFRKCPIFEADYRDAAEFEARVAAKLAFFEDGCTPCSKPKKCPFEALDIIECVPCRLKYVRLAVEAEMEQN